MPKKISVPVKHRSRDEVQLTTIIAKNGDTISWDAQSSDITVFIPEALELFGLTQKVFDVASGGKNGLTVKVQPASGEEKRYKYAVYHKKIKDFAVGNSSPEIIIRG